MKQNWNSFKEIHTTGIRLLGIVHGMDRNLIPCNILAAVFSAMLPYISIIMSAEVIDLLISGCFREAAAMALAMTGCGLVMELLRVLLLYKINTAGDSLQDKLAILIRKKGMELDYATMDDPEILQIIRNAESAAQYNGGLTALLKRYASLLEYLLSSAAAILLTVQFCLAVPEGTVKNMLLYAASRPAVTFGILSAAWLLGVFITKRQAAAIKRLENEIEEQHFKVEGHVQYWLWYVLMDISMGKLIRVNGMAGLVNHNSRKWWEMGRPLFEKMGVSESKQILSEGAESGLFSVAAYFLVLVKVLTDAVSLGSFTKYSGALLQFNRAGSKIVWSENEINRLTKNLVHFVEFMERKNQMETGSIHIEKRLDNRYEIEFRDVSFRYPGNEAYALRHVNAAITLKNKLAVVGKNGAGKSTFIKLLCRLYDPTEGVITLNGVDIRKYNYEEYLRLFGVVFQDFHLFGYPVAQNVAVSPDYDRELVEKCLKQAGAYEFVADMPEGIETVIENGEEGINLSGGQSQKISIARALYKDAPFVILDEPTAALDPVSEAEIYERFNEMVRDKTSVYISHRMSSCRFCDEILVFDKGGICERGSHEKLVEKDGLYAALWRAQAKYYA